MKVLNRQRLVLVNGLLCLALLVSLMVCVFIGPVPVDPFQAFQSGLDDAQADILLRARLPRVLLSAIVGAGLSLSGLVLQAFLRNPLACAHTLGVSGGASLGGIVGIAVLSHLTGSAQLSWLSEISWAPVSSSAGALASMLLIYRYSLVHGRLQPYHLLLCGVIFNAFVGAALMFLNSVLDFYQAQGLLFWLMGSLTTRSYTTVAFVWGYVLLGFIWVWSQGFSLNLLTLGEEGAMQLGIDVHKLQRNLFFASSMIVGVIVSISGMIGFVGLMVPHVLRLLFGNDHRLLLPASFLAGATFLVWADTFARTALAPVELPVGVITAFLGGPFFFFLLYRQGRKSALYELGH
ncbi:MAG: FecCD family ABC transporter permease [Candidatus Binatia bacterium]